MKPPPKAPAMPQPLLDPRRDSSAIAGTAASQLDPQAEGTSRPIGVFVAEGHRITLWGLQQLIGASEQPRMTVTGTALTAGEMLEHDGLGRSDIVLLGLDLDGGAAGAALQQLQQRTSDRIILLTRDENHDHRQAAVLHGVRGVLHKNHDAEVVLRAIDKVHQGELWLERSLLSRVLEQALRAQQQPSQPATPAAAPVTAPRSGSTASSLRVASLTPRERSIVEAVGRQSSAKLMVIATQLGMSENTLRNHLTTIYSKLGVHSRLELHVFASENALVT